MKKYNFIQNNFYILKMIAGICPGRIFATFFNSFVNYFSQVFFSIVFLSYLVDALEKGTDFEQTAVFVVAFMGVFLLIHVFQAWYYSKYLPHSDQELNNKINKRLFDKVSQVDISCFEIPDFYDKYTAAINEANSRAVSILENLAGITAAVISASYRVVRMASLDTLAPFFIIIPIVGSLLMGNLQNKVNYKQDMDNIPLVRKIDYVNRAVFQRKYAKEIRLSNISNVLYDDYDEALDGLLKTEKLLKAEVMTNL